MLNYTSDGCCTVMEKLGKSWNLKMVIYRPGKVLEKQIQSQKFWKNQENVLHSCVHLC